MMLLSLFPRGISIGALRVTFVDPPLDGDMKLAKSSCAMSFPYTVIFDLWKQHLQPFGYIYTNNKFKRGKLTILRPRVPYARRKFHFYY
jgi:hypothetical protein